MKCPALARLPFHALLLLWLVPLGAASSWMYLQVPVLGWLIRQGEPVPAAAAPSPG